MSPSTLAEEPNLTFFPNTGPIILPLITKSSEVTDPTTFADFSITNFDAFISPSRTPSNRSAPFEVIFPITFISSPIMMVTSYPQIHSQKKCQHSLLDVAVSVMISFFQNLLFYFSRIKNHYFNKLFLDNVCDIKVPQK